MLLANNTNVKKSKPGTSHAAKNSLSPGLKDIGKPRRNSSGAAAPKQIPKVASDSTARKALNISQLKVMETGPSDIRCHESCSALKYSSAPPLAANIGRNHALTVTIKANNAMSPWRKLAFCNNKSHNGARNSIVDCRITATMPKAIATGMIILLYLYKHANTRVQLNPSNRLPVYRLKPQFHETKLRARM